MRCSELSSLHAALLYIGKTEESIQSFADTEEPRLRIQLSDIVYRHWRAWFWGVDDPGLRGHERPPEDGQVYYDLI